MNDEQTEALKAIQKMLDQVQYATLKASIQRKLSVDDINAMRSKLALADNKLKNIQKEGGINAR